MSGPHLFHILLHLLLILFLSASALGLSTRLRITNRPQHDFRNLDRLSSRNIVVGKLLSADHRHVNTSMYTSERSKSVSLENQVVGDGLKGGEISVQPTLSELVKFALPCLCLWISGPLLSLVDTASVGRTAKLGEVSLSR